MSWWWAARFAALMLGGWLSWRFFGGKSGRNAARGFRWRLELDEWRARRNPGPLRVTWWQCQTCGFTPAWDYQPDKPPTTPCPANCGAMTWAPSR